MPAESIPINPYYSADNQLVIIGTEDGCKNTYFLISKYVFIFLNQKFYKLP